MGNKMGNFTLKYTPVCLIHSTGTNYKVNMLAHVDPEHAKYKHV